MKSENWAEAPARYELLQDGLSFGVDLAKASRRVSRTIHTSLREEVEAIEEFNRGAKRGETILVTGDRPRFALMRNYPEDKSDPDLIKLGDLRIGLETAAAFEWLDLNEGIKTVFRPSCTEYSIESKTEPGLRIDLIVSQAEDWGAVSRLTLANAGSEPIDLTIRLAFGGLARHGRTFTASYFDSAKDDLSGNELSIRGSSANFSDAGIPEKVCAWSSPPVRPEIEGQRAIFRHAVAVGPGESRAIFLTAGRLGAPGGTEEEMQKKDPEELIREASRHYERLLSGISISTPSRLIDSGFLTGVVNLEYDYACPLWLEGVHWWASFWPDNFQISAAIALGQVQRARKALEYLGSLDCGPCPALMASGKMFSSHIGVYDYGIEEGLPYYLYQLLQYLEHSGDLELLRGLWQKIRAAIDLLFSKRANSGSGLLDWHLGCNGFLYQADHLAMPGDAASPSIFVSWLLGRLSEYARTLGEHGDSEKWELRSERMREKIVSRLWNEKEGSFYNHVDYQGIRHRAHFYTDLAFPVLYSDFPEDKVRRSMDSLCGGLVFETADKRLLMRVGDFKPSIFGNDNVAPAQMCEAARALFKTGDGGTGFRLLESVALAATVYTEAPGNFPERMDEDGKGEANYIFGNPIGAYVYSVISGLFGIELKDGGRTLGCSPSFPPDWDRADLRLPYCSLAYLRRGAGGEKTATYAIQSGPARILDFSLLLDAKEIKSIRCAQGPVEKRTAAEFGMKRVALISSFPSERFDISIEYTAAEIPRGRHFAGPGTKQGPSASASFLEGVDRKDMRPLDLAGLCDSDRIHATSAWRNEEMPIDLSRYGKEGTGIEIEGLSFHMEEAAASPRLCARMILLESGTSDTRSGATLPSKRSKGVSIAIAARIRGLALLYASECQSRQTGVEVGSIRLIYQGGDPGRIPLIIGKNLDSLFSHFAEDAIAVGIPGSMENHPGHPAKDYINLLAIPCDPGRILESLELILDLPDVQMGIIAIDLIGCAEELTP